MMKPNMMLMILFMFTIMIINLLTLKTSMMCINLLLYTMILSMITSVKMKLTPLPFIVFLTMIGGLMIIFLYFAATMWTKMEKLTLSTKILIMITLLIPVINPSKYLNESTHPTLMNVFNHPMSKTTILLMLFLVIMLVFTIELHMKANSTFRQKLKIWE